ncbi:hypothetical protein [Aliiroseovarius sp. F20344]|uniref:hypothetical protein n=1 Tax=Aliiroseovarius sp. F20344 TaxID=2926414 RepID=UPI001FF5E779|nr:hypothetical protein [Aliiroseovarius sp. F20344]MCK0143108.1 hypothetical protein [Aliiroseovarius sp. F20344]
MLNTIIMVKDIIRKRRATRGVKLKSMASAIVAGFGFVGASLLPAQAQDIAFPGAIGFGAKAVGWKGGDVVAVTTLADSGPGSLRACVKNREQPRVCIFRVSGTIMLDSPIFVGSNLYIAGQTAPGKGIQLRNRNSIQTPLILKNSRQVVMRFLKVRPGPSITPSANVDAVTLEDTKNIYLGNLSMNFATDETFNIHVSGGKVVNITLADSILALSLDRSTHPKGKHSKGALICSHEQKNNSCGRITLARNLFAHHRDRMPDIKGTNLGPIEVLNNVFYNPISQFGEFYDLLGNVKIIYGRNIALSGPSTLSKTPAAVQVFEWKRKRRVSLMAFGNKTGAATGCNSRKFAVLNSTAKARRIPTTSGPFSAPLYKTNRTLHNVLTQVGDRMPGDAHLDRLDKRVINDALKCRGKVINSVEEVGGWPEIQSAPAPADRDSDGLPDYYEAATAGLSPTQPNNPWKRPRGSDYSHLEIWLATLAGDLE